MYEGQGITSQDKLFYWSNIVAFLYITNGQNSSIQSNWPVCLAWHWPKHVTLSPSVVWLINNYTVYKALLENI